MTIIELFNRFSGLFDVITFYDEKNSILDTLRHDGTETGKEKINNDFIHEYGEEEIANWYYDTLNNAICIDF